MSSADIHGGEPTAPPSAPVIPTQPTAPSSGSTPAAVPAPAAPTAVSPSAAPPGPPPQYAQPQYAPPGPQTAPPQYAPPGPQTAPPPYGAPYGGVPQQVAPPPMSAPPAYPFSAPPMSAVPGYGQPGYGQPGYGYPAGYAPAGYPPPGYGYPYAAPPVPAARRGIPVWVTSLVVIVLVVVVGAASGIVSFVAGAGDPTTAAWRGAGGVLIGQQPGQNAPSTEWTSWARRAAEAAVTAQGAALLSDNEGGYVALADPSDTATVTLLQHRFQALTAMGLGVWKQVISGGLRLSGNRTWTADLHINYCFGESTCQQVELTESTQWTVKGDRLVMSKLTGSDSYDNGPRPWEADALSVKTGKRVVVVATQANKWRLADAVVDADKAAQVADQFAHWEPPPSRYFISFADPQDWRTWYGHEQPGWAAAWSVPVSDTVTEIMVRSDVVSQSELTMLLTHEMTHVTTLAGKRDGARLGAWWLIEGIAEYSSHLDQPFAEYDGVTGTRQYVRQSWNGDPAVDPPGADASQLEATGKYGVAYLSVRRIAEKYGRDKMLDFWGRIVHDDMPIESAATAALGASWTTVKADCAKYVRAAVNGA